MIEYIVSYLIGSIPFSYIVPKALRGVDVQKHGDGNVGAMNAYYSTGDIKIGILCFTLDFLKGLIPTLIFGPVAGAFAVLGHQYSIFMAIKNKFKRLVSGLGMASSIGVFITKVPLLILLTVVLYVAYVFLLAPKDPFKWHDEEQGNMETVFALGSAYAIYVALVQPGAEILRAITIILLGSYVAYARRISGQLKERWK